MMFRSGQSPVMLFGLLVVPAVLLGQGRGQSAPPMEPLMSRAGVAAGMGVSYVSAPDVVAVVNSLVYSTERLQQFRPGVEFFGAAVLPLSPDLALKLDYAYLLLSYDGETPYGPGSFTVQAHLPTLVLQYALADAGLYDLKVGGGLGYHVGALSESYGTVNDRFTGQGLGMLGELEANTAFGDHLFGYLGAIVRWDFIGSLTSPSGKNAGGTASGGPPTLRFFGVGARLGMSYYF